MVHLKTLPESCTIVAYRLRVRSSKREGTAVAREQLGKYVPAATDTHATIEESLETVFSVRSVPIAMLSVLAIFIYSSTFYLSLSVMSCNKRKAMEAVFSIGSVPRLYKEAR
jgi:hypothetical protein